MFDLDRITRKNIKELIPFSAARDEFAGEAEIWLDANENPFETAFNRYPDPYQSALKKAIATLKSVQANQTFIGNGSDEVIDLLFRAFCEPQQDFAYIFPPTFGMYELCAHINNVEIVKIPLNDRFALPEIELIASNIKSKGLLFLCSPNNPTGNIHALSEIEQIASIFQGLVVVDEAYIDFSDEKSTLAILNNTPNLVIIQTMSKAYGLAGLRLGLAFANPKIIDILNKIKPPYNISTLSQAKGLATIENIERVKEQITEIKIQREMLMDSLEKIKCVTKVYPSEANFILATFENPIDVFTTLKNHGIIIRNRTQQVRNALRITVGTAEENQRLLEILNCI